MNKKVLFSALTIWLLSTAISFAQFSIGINGGINMANMYADQETTRDWTWGAGGVIEYYLGKHFAIQAEPMFLNKGGIIEGTGSNPRITIDLDAIEVPLLLKYDFNVPEDMYVLVGPSFAFLHSAEIGVEINNNIFKADVKNILENFELGAAVGVGIKVPLPVGEMFLETKYTHGFTNMSNDGQFKAKWQDIEIDGELNEKETKFRTFGIQFMLGYVIEL